MATNKPAGDNARKGAVKKRSQLATKTMGKKTFTKRNKEGGQFMAQKKKTKLEGVRKEGSPGAKDHLRTENSRPRVPLELFSRGRVSFLPSHGCIDYKLRCPPARWQS